jgi:hypothetical protein
MPYCWPKALSQNNLYKYYATGIISWCNLQPGGCLKKGAGSPVNSAIHPAAPEHPGVGGIDDGIDFSGGDIPLDNLYAAHIILPGISFLL